MKTEMHPNYTNSCPRCGRPKWVHSKVCGIIECRDKDKNLRKVVKMKPSHKCFCGRRSMRYVKEDKYYKYYHCAYCSANKKVKKGIV